MMVVFRCIPWHACSDFDEQVVRRDETILSLMDEFVCLRMIQFKGATRLSSNSITTCLSR